MNQITDPYGVLFQFTQAGYDADEITEFLFSLSAINGIETHVETDRVEYDLPVGKYVYPLLLISAKDKTAEVSRESVSYLINRTAAESFLADIEHIFITDCIPIDDALANSSDIVLAVYRLVYEIRYQK